MRNNGAGDPQAECDPHIVRPDGLKKPATRFRWNFGRRIDAF
ncbi:hypothetical protein NEIPOLOT_01737 [Neisseria polysaccharea ATCC 43768]|nr:hypothetical protein NEIPOLOT_01737 [Neisseria polysaccharea ATCC 43768]